MITEIRGSHLLLALDYTNFKLKETGEIAQSIQEKILILSKLTNVRPMVLVNTINNNDIVHKSVLDMMGKAKLKVPFLEKVSIDPPAQKPLAAKRNATSITASLDVVTKKELEEMG